MPISSLYPCLTRVLGRFLGRIRWAQSKLLFLCQTVGSTVDLLSLKPIVNTFFCIPSMLNLFEAQWRLRCPPTERLMNCGFGPVQIGVWLSKSSFAPRTPALEDGTHPRLFSCDLISPLQRVRRSVLRFHRYRRSVETNSARSSGKISSGHYEFRFSIWHLTRCPLRSTPHPPIHTSI
jgi:hypothetical protein